MDFPQMSLTQLKIKPEFAKFIIKLFTRGTSAFLIIFGRRETGKTDFGLLIAEILYNAGIVKHVATNTKIYSGPFHIEQITNLEDLKYWSKNNPGRKLFNFDEYGKAMRRRSPMSSLNVKLIDRLQVLRKFKTSTVAITVDEKYVDNASLGSDVLDGYFVKPTYKNRKIALYNDLLEMWTRTLRGIPRTSFHFDQWDVAPFTEFGEKRKPKFKTKELADLWDLAHGASYKDVGLHQQQVARLWRKYIKDYMEREQSQVTDN